eukprot:CAMPEP_0114140140 /NCGR_PEP_ID=MMETSP0043_2-20121206/17222_1 /TAXON_ID=464988 /ORGANISM="Hemiselmis andersenii, Strain CCMP644" /LENGTH=146 /DNA_ID=CAMNT_0001234207 /DNA_START=245 /DNA_END=685 /DNA_ORIENTATION=-
MKGGGGGGVLISGKKEGKSADLLWLDGPAPVCSVGVLGADARHHPCDHLPWFGVVQPVEGVQLSVCELHVRPGHTLQVPLAHLDGVSCAVEEGVSRHNRDNLGPGVNAHAELERQPQLVKGARLFEGGVVGLAPPCLQNARRSHAL